MIRVGQGYDAHPLVEGRDLVLGGVKIEHNKGLQGHSDADVLIHAVCDAVLGAAGLGDIGQHFPDTDRQYQGIDSRVLLRRVNDAITEAKWYVVNVDATIIAQAPRLAAYLPAMVSNIAADLDIPADHVSIKATTTEGLGFTGHQEGIAAQAVVLVERKD